MPIPLWILAEVIGSGLALGHDVVHSLNAARHPENEEMQRDRPGIMDYALDIGSGALGLGAVRGGAVGMKLAEDAAAAAKARGAGIMGQAGAGMGTVMRHSVMPPPAAADEAFRAELARRARQATAPIADESIPYTYATA